MDRLAGSSQLARRYQILLQVDAEGPALTNRRGADAFHYRVDTVEIVRQQCVMKGFDAIWPSAASSPATRLR